MSAAAAHEPVDRSQAARSAPLRRHASAPRRRHRAARQPKLIIIDEPTAGLDPQERVRFLNLLSEIGEDSVVITSPRTSLKTSRSCATRRDHRQRRDPAEAEPMRAIGELRGRIWRRTVSRDELGRQSERPDCK